MRGSVLVVDDDSGFLRLASTVLNRAGLRVVATADTAAAALSAAARHRPEAMLVDVDLPDRSGADLGRDLAALPWAPRVVLTSCDRDAGRLASLPFVPKEELPGAPLRELLTGS